MTRSLRDLSLAVALILVLAADTRLSAQGLSRSAESLYANASAEENAVRRVLASPRPSITVLKAVRTVVLDYEAFVRRHPESPYADDGLWRGALLASDAFRIFGDPHEQQSATRMLQMLIAQYSSSKLAKQGPALIAELSVLPSKAPVSSDKTTAIAPTPVASPASTTGPRLPVPALAGPATTANAELGVEPRSEVKGDSNIEPGKQAKSSTGVAARATQDSVATIKGIRRLALGDVVRVVIELDREVSFRDERLGNPHRVFVDLAATSASKELRDQTLRFDDDNDPVRQVRLGRHPNNTTRVVLEAAGVSSYSIYSLYNPFRLVIDCLREQPNIQIAGGAAWPAPAPRPAEASTSDIAAMSPAVKPPAKTATRLSAPATPPPIPATRVEVWSRATPYSESANGAAIRETLVAQMPAVPPAAPITPATVASLPIAPSIIAPSRMLSGGLSLARQLGLGVSRIVIDPGHGGHDPGAKGGGSNEADLVLDIALRLEKLLQSSPDMEVILTRRHDEYVTLQERTAIANREGADLFLSIHANASKVSSARGVETYFLNFANNLTAAATAARENAASGQSMGELPDAVKAIALNNKLEESKDFATYVQREMVRNLGASGRSGRDLGVKQAPFQVLIGAAMPSILAEIAFLSNAQESRLVRQPAYRQRIAEALYNAVRTYQNSLSHLTAAKLER